MLPVLNFQLVKWPLLSVLLSEIIRPEALAKLQLKFMVSLLNYLQQLAFHVLQQCVAAPPDSFTAAVHC